MTARGNAADVAVLLLYTALSGLLCPAVHASPGLPAGRELLQQDASVPVVLTDNNITEIADELGNLEDGSVLVLAVESVTLSSSLMVAAAVTIRGESIDSRPEITCAGGGVSQPAFQIQAGATLENLVIKRCGGPTGPAVSLSSLDVTQTTPVTFRGVSFEENSFKGAVLFNGGAIGASAGFDLIVDQCSFLNNTASAGAGIFADGSSLTVTNSTFVGNTLGSPPEFNAGSGAAIAVLNNLPQNTGVSLTVSGCSFSGNTDQTGRFESASSLVNRATGAPLERAEFVSFGTPVASGGAISAQALDSVTIEDSNFTGNIGIVAGGAVRTADVKTCSIQNCNFTDNEARSEDPSENELALGGALYVEMKQDSFSLEIKGTNFVNNSGGYGGGAHIVGASKAPCRIETVDFIGNRAISGGGALVVRNIERAVMLDTRFLSNVARQGGGALFANGAGMQQTGALGRESGSKYEGNVAFIGGGLAALGAGNIDIELIAFRDNHAQLSGGGIAMVDGTVGTVLSMESLDLVGNSAKRGGGLFVDSVARIGARPANPDLKNSFTSNVALEGGGIFVQAQGRTANTFTLIQAIIKGNAAVTSFSDLMATEGNQSDFFRRMLGNDMFEALQDVVLRRATKLANLTDLLGNSMVEGDLEVLPAPNSNLTLGGGGGALLGLSQGFSQGGVDVSFEESDVENNVARVGAGLLLLVDGDEWQRECDGRPVATCRSVKLRDVTFSQNGALSSGAAIFATNPKNVFVEKVTRRGSRLVPLSKENVTELSDFLVDNTVASGGFGIVASLADHLEVVEPKVVNGFIEMPNLLGHNSIEPLPPFIVEVKDVYNQTVVGGSSDANMNIEAKSESISGLSQGDVLSGGRFAQAVRGTANFTDAFARALNGVYSLKFSALDQGSVSSVESNELKFLVRDCVIGEERKDVSCLPCSADFFSLVPEQGCRACPDDAFCPGGAAVVPDDGFWHSTPFSPEISRCLFDTACAYENRTAKLQAFFLGVTEPRTDVTQDEYPQCDEGYKGPLCGSCTEGFGKLESACVKCHDDPSIQRFYIFLIQLWSLAVLAFTIRSAVTAGHDMKEMNAYIQSASCSNTSAVPEHRAGPLASKTELPAPGGHMDSASAAHNGGVVDAFDHEGVLSHRDSGLDGHTDAHQQEGAAGSAPPTAAGPLSPRLPRSNTIASRHIARELERVLGQPDLKTYSKATFDILGMSGRAGQRPADNSMTPSKSEAFKAIEHIIASELLSETVKIGTNFLQVTSFAIAINSDWSKSVKKLLGVQDILAGFSSGSSFVSTECAISTESSVPTVIGATLVTIFSPFILMLMVQWFFLLYWVYLYIQHRKPISYLTSRLMLTAITSIFFAYSNVTEELMNTLNCVTPDNGTPPREDIPKEYSMYSTAQDTFWVEDTGLRCFKDDHRYIAYIVGIPGLVLFSFGIPALLLVFLFAKKDVLYTEEYLHTYGFVYEAYADNHMYWEVVTMARKALVAAIVVYGYTLGPHLQAVLALGVLIVALVLHIIVHPYKYDRLNDLEGLSLVVTTLTMYSALVFGDDNASDAGRAIMSVFILILNIGVVAILVFEIHLSLDRYCDSKIGHYGGKIPKAGGVPMKLFVLGTAVLKQNVTNINYYGPGQGGYVVKAKVFIARLFGWTIKYKSVHGIHIQRHESKHGPLEGVDVGIHPIPEERSGDIESSVSLTMLPVEDDETSSSPSPNAVGNQNAPDGTNGVAIELAPRR